jgi:hypothetical protein
MKVIQTIPVLGNWQPFRDGHTVHFIGSFGPAQGVIGEGYVGAQGAHRERAGRNSAAKTGCCRGRIVIKEPVVVEDGLRKPPDLACRNVVR